MGFILKDGEEGLAYVVCCEAIGRAARVVKREEADCAPFLGECWPVKLYGCDAAIDRDPIRFCPWCGRAIVRKHHVSGER